MGALRVALVDDHVLFRQGLRALMTTAGVEVVGEAEDARGAYQIVERDRPDVVLMDVGLPGVDGISATRELRRRDPQVRILILSMHLAERMVLDAFAAGASGYALKNQEADVIVSAMRTVAEGRTYLAPRFPEELLERTRLGRPTGPLATLSAREREVFHLLVRGFSNRVVSEQLCISIKTVETHRLRIHRKLGVHSVAQLLRFAMVNGLVEDVPTAAAAAPKR